MTKKTFYGNNEDNKHSVLAVYKMLFDVFLHRKLSWEEAEKMAAYDSTQPLSTGIMWERMRNQGFDIQTVEGRNPTLDDMDDLLYDKRLVFLTLGSSASDGVTPVGALPRAVLVIAQDNNDYVVRDPADLSKPDHRIPREELWESMGAEKSTSEVTGVKFKMVRTRADVVLARYHPEYSRAALAKLFDMGLVSFNGKQLKTGDKVLPDSVLDADLSPLTPSSTDIDIPILYEDDDCVVMNKPAGVLTHVQGAFSPEATVASFLRHRLKDMEGSRAGIVHRLDRPTSGVIIGAKNPQALQILQKQFADRKAHKTYTAIVKGHLKEDEAIIDMPIERNPRAPATFRVGPNGKSATTKYKVIQANENYSLVELYPKTGRTHQLRVHMAQIGHPIIGDPLYGKGEQGDRLYLHAKQLELTLPNGEHKVFTAPLPPEFEELMQQ
ncbi:MAG TPA: RluA family pseudouridine synthase [Candidatus Saccharimonadales bacterium]